MEIVKLEKNDISKIVDLFNEQFKNESWTENQILESFNSNATKFYGIIKNNVLICVASILITIDDINLLDIATKEEYKRQGYATKLLKYIISLKKENQSVSLEVKSKNLPAIDLYESVGFKTLNVRHKYYKDGDDALCMFIISN